VSGKWGYGSHRHSRVVTSLGEDEGIGPVAAHVHHCGDVGRCRRIEVEFAIDGGQVFGQRRVQLDRGGVATTMASC
jgi:hypothetical protein